MDDLSPLFALEAEQLMLDGKTDEAIWLCNAGLQEYPDYPAAYAVLAQAYIELEDIDTAEDSIKRGLLLFPENPKLIQMDEILKSSVDNPILYQKPVKIDFRKLDKIDSEYDDERVDVDENDEPESYQTTVDQTLDVPSGFTDADLNEDIPKEIDDEQINVDDIDDMFEKQEDEKELPNDFTEKVEDEQISDDDTVPMIENNVQEEETIEPDISESDLIEKHTFSRDELRSSNLSIIKGFEMKLLSIKEDPEPLPKFYESFPEIPPYGFEDKSINTKEISIIKVLAQKIKENSSDTIENENRKNTDSDDNLIVSDTMASIYLQQGFLTKALDTYKLLSEKEDDPTKKEEYLEKIKSIQDKL